MRPKSVWRYISTKATIQCAVSCATPVDWWTTNRQFHGRVNLFAVSYSFVFVCFFNVELKFVCLNNKNAGILAFVLDSRQSKYVKMLTDAVLHKLCYCVVSCVAYHNEDNSASLFVDAQSSAQGLNRLIEAMTVPDRHEKMFLRLMYVSFDSSDADAVQSALDKGAELPNDVSHSSPFGIACFHAVMSLISSTIYFSARMDVHFRRLFSRYLNEKTVGTPNQYTE